MLLLECNTSDKTADLVGPGIGDSLELEKILPDDYSSLLSLKETQKALFEVVREKEHSCVELAVGT